MGWRFRKSFSPLPGVRITLSPRGLSTSIGVGPLRATLGPQGPAITTRIPGTGIAFRQALGKPHGPRHRDIPAFPAQHSGQPSPEVLSPAPELESIKSAGSACLTTSGLSEFKRLLEQARREHGAIVGELDLARREESINSDRYTSWKNGFLLRRLFKAKYEQLRAAADESVAKRAELEEQERLARLQTQIDIPDAVAGAFHLLCDEFAQMAKASRIWDTVGQRSTDRARERTSATRTIDRKPVAFRLGRCEIIESEWMVPHLANANGGDIYLFPAFAVYFISADSFALLEYKDIRLEYAPQRFIEEEGVPDDAVVIGNTWKKVNKDGTPDRRFKDNHQIPVAQYGRIAISSTTGMNEEYMVSSAESAKAFTSAWMSLVKVIPSVDA